MTATVSDSSKKKSKDKSPSNQKPVVNGQKNGDTNIGERRRKKKKKKNKQKEPDDPMQIVESVLANSSFKKANLSELIVKHFNEPENRSQLVKLLKDVSYCSTVGKVTGTHSDINISVLPKGCGDIKINLPPTALTDINCIYDQGPVRWRKRGRARKNNKNKNPAIANKKSESNKLEAGEGNNKKLKTDKV